MKDDFFSAPGLRIQRQVDKWNGPMYLAWKPNASMCFGDRSSSAPGQSRHRQATAFGNG